MFYKVLGVAFVAVVSYGVVKAAKPELSVFLPIVGGIVILILLSDGIVQSVEAFSVMAGKAGINNEVFSSVLKIVGIGVLTEYASNLCDDAGCTAIGRKVELGGKITIFLSALPIVTGIVELIESLL